jgi:hypothetical protein
MSQIWQWMTITISCGRAEIKAVSSILKLQIIKTVLRNIFNKYIVNCIMFPFYNHKKSKINIFRLKYPTNVFKQYLADLSL